MQAGAVLRVAATYMGTVVGAGFASGQEALRFFTAFGRQGLWGLGLATALLCGYGALVAELGHRLGARSHREVLRYGCGPRLGAVADGLVTAFLLAILSVMLAGGGAVAREQYGLPAWAGAGAMALLTVATLLAGLGGLVAANGAVVPLMVALLLALSLSALRGHGPVPVPAAPALAAAPHWALGAGLYAAYNLVLSIGVLAPLGAATSGRGARVAGAVAGGLGLGVLGLALYLALGAHLPAAAHHQVPVLYLARQHPPVVQALYSLVLWAEVYTTAIASAFALVSRVRAARWARHLPAHWAAAGAVALALVGSPFGFARLVESLYPAFGAACLGVLLLLGYRFLRSGGLPPAGPPPAASARLRWPRGQATMPR